MPASVGELATKYFVARFRTETFRMNHVISFLCLIAAVYFAFRK
jgi:uncharacterized protein (DUF486 family)